MAPELVVVPVGDTHKIYPGGVIAVKAAEFLGPARGTLSTEANTLASTGTVVRETQQIASVNPPFLDDASYQNADDTLVIPAADIGIENDMDYRIYFTMLVEGEWDLTNEPLLRQCSNLVYESVVSYGAHGTASEPEASPNFDDHVVCRIPNFQVQHVRLIEIATTDTLHFRFYAQSGTDAEILIDQLVFLPNGDPGDWVNSIDIREVFVQGVSGTPAVQDGADGGDDNGEYTWYMPGVFFDNFRNGGSGDFQRMADGDDAEYHQRISETAGNIMYNSVTDLEAAVDGYGLYSARYRGPITYSEDTFDNRSTSTTGQDMGVDEAGYGWSIGSSSSAGDPDCFVDSGVGVMRLNQDVTLVAPHWGSSVQGSGGTSNQGAELNAYDQWIFSGVLEHTAGTTNSTTLRIRSAFSPVGAAWEIRISMADFTWEIGYFNGTTFTNLGASTHDISSWLGVGVPFGFKIEIKRYVIRCKVWEVSGGEPGTWDEEFFKPAQTGLTAYPYGGSEARAQEAYFFQRGFGFQLQNGSDGNTFPYDITIHNVKFEHDPYGDPEDMSVRMERPEGTTVGDMVIPWGCAYWVYWDRRDWTDPHLTTWRLEFSERVWNDPAAAEIQRAETIFWYFRSVHFTPEIANMNWRSSDRYIGQITRVHER